MRACSAKGGCLDPELTLDAEAFRSAMAFIVFFVPSTLELLNGPAEEEKPKPFVLSEEAGEISGFALPSHLSLKESVIGPPFDCHLLDNCLPLGLRLRGLLDFPLHRVILGSMPRYGLYNAARADAVECSFDSLLEIRRVDCLVGLGTVFLTDLSDPEKGPGDVSASLVIP